LTPCPPPVPPFTVQVICSAKPKTNMKTDDDKIELEKMTEELAKLWDATFALEQRVATGVLGQEEEAQKARGALRAARLCINAAKWDLLSK